jgi:plasmid stability protein
LSEPNYAGSIIVILANLPDFLRKPILKKRMAEFYSISNAEKIDLIKNALEAGPTIPFLNFAKLFKTWLEILAEGKEEERKMLFSSYITEISKFPQKLIAFNLDGILEIYLSIEERKKTILNNSLKMIIENLDEEIKRKLLLLIPNGAKKELKI